MRATSTILAAVAALIWAQAAYGYNGNVVWISGFGSGMGEYTPIRIADVDNMVAEGDLAGTVGTEPRTRSSGRVRIWATTSLI